MVREVEVAATRFGRISTASEIKLSHVYCFTSDRKKMMCLYVRICKEMEMKPDTINFKYDFRFFCTCDTYGI